MQPVAHDLARRVLVPALLATILAATAFGTSAAQAAPFERCTLSLKDQDPPGGTPAFALTVFQRRTTCRTATAVMRSFHRCRTEGGRTCGRRVLTRWSCRGTRAEPPGPRGLPRLFHGAFTCTSGTRGVRSAYEEFGPRCFGAAARDPKRPCVFPDRTVTPGIGEPEPYALDPGASGCDPGIVPGACLWGVPAAQATRRIALVGDSHTYHWRAALALVAQIEHWTAYSISAGGCFFSAVVGSFLPDCVPAFYDPALAWFRAHPEVDTVFVTSNADTPVAIPAGKTYAQYKAEGFRTAWQALPKTVKHIVVLRDTTVTRQENFDCVARVIAEPSGDPGTSCPLARSEAIREDVGIEAARSLHSKRYQSIDLTRYMCDASACYPVVGGVRVNGDIFGHLHVSFTRTLGPFLLRAIRRLMAGW